MDFGNSCSITADDIKELPNHLKHIPPQAVNCCLKGLEKIREIPGNNAGLIMSLFQNRRCKLTFYPNIKVGFHVLSPSFKRHLNPNAIKKPSLLKNFYFRRFLWMKLSAPRCASLSGRFLWNWTPSTWRVSWLATGSIGVPFRLGRHLWSSKKTTEVGRAEGHKVCGKQSYRTNSLNFAFNLSISLSG